MLSASCMSANYKPWFINSDITDTDKSWVNHSLGWSLNLTCGIRGYICLILHFKLVQNDIRRPGSGGKASQDPVGLSLCSYVN